ncbi:MAG: sensor histidine kinase [Actinomycetales bacterium]
MNPVLREMSPVGSFMPGRSRPPPDTRGTSARASAAAGPHLVGRGPRAARPRLARFARGWRRPAPEELFGHYRSYFLVGILGFRGLSALPPLFILAAAYGVVGPVMWLAVVWAVAVTANFLMIPVLLRHVDLSTRRVLPWLGLDTAAAVALNTWGAWMVPGSVNEPYHDLFFFWYLGTALLWSAWFGSRAGLVLSLAAVPLQVLMTLLSGGESLADAVGMVVGRTAWLLVGTFSGSLVLWVMQVATDEVRAEGVRAGHKAAQVQALRHVHDTALQTLEAIGLTAENDQLAMRHRLESVGAAARRQAVDIRAVLADQTDEPSQNPVDRVARVVATLQPGLRAAGIELTCRDRWDGEVLLDTARVKALTRAVHESLTNVAKHSRARSATVGVAVHGQRVQVTVHDDGCGFDPDRDEGFGIRHSVRARLDEVGGGAVIRSWPGHGSSIELWVPR